MSLIVRDVTAADEAPWRVLWGDYIEFYKADVADDVTDATWARLLDAQSPLFGLVAQLNGDVVGMVNCVLHANTWATQPVCYLEDLFTAEPSRGHGAGRAMINAVTARAQAENWLRVYWRTAADNTTAQTLYDKLAKRTDWVTYEVDT